MIRVYKIELLVVDHDGCGAEQIKGVLENQRYPNYCISPSVMDVAECDIEWSDDHPLNCRGTRAETYAKLFAPVCMTCGKARFGETFECGSCVSWRHSR